ncbi:MAG: hypothetical protein IT369_02470 [Candidatus Latescibacteria bacterium]|nr:hypothetical protein [Candidatus Latescibacterota bacterium]
MKTWIVVFAALWACACGRREAGAPEPGSDYMREVQQVLLELRVLDKQIASQVTADTIAANTIVPLIRDQFRPALAGLRQRVAALQPDSALTPVNEQLVRYLDLRLKAYDLAIQGEQEQRQDLFEEFARLQVQADAEGRSLEEEIRQARQRR